MDLGWAGLNETRKGKGCADGMGSTLHYLQYGVRITCVCGYSDDYLPYFTSLFFCFFWERDKTDMWGMSKLDTNAT